MVVGQRNYIFYKVLLLAGQEVDWGISLPGRPNWAF
jgi:hypothetical protein